MVFNKQKTTTAPSTYNINRNNNNGYNSLYHHNILPLLLVVFFLIRFHHTYPIPLVTLASSLPHLDWYRSQPSWRPDAQDWWQSHGRHQPWLRQPV